MNYIDEFKTLDLKTRITVGAILEVAREYFNKEMEEGEMRRWLVKLIEQYKNNGEKK